MNDEWWFKELGQEFGPVPFEVLLDSAKRGLIGPNDPVRGPNMKDWVPASSVPELNLACHAHVEERVSPQVDDRHAAPSAEPLASEFPAAIEPEDVIPGETPLQRKRRKLRARLPMINRVKDEAGFPWLETILGVSAVSLVFQLYPPAWWAILGALDVRNWTRTHGLIANVVGLAILFAIIVAQKHRAKQAER